MPNGPTTMRSPPPTAKGATMQVILKALPDVNTTALGMTTVWTLSNEPSDRVDKQVLQFSTLVLIAWCSHTFLASISLEATAVVIKGLEQGSGSTGIPVDAEHFHKRRLGNYRTIRFTERTPHQFIKEFHVKLAEISKCIQERNKTMHLPYPYLDPSEIENSVSI
ncbi:hypothetical protein AB205_0195900 [Aquarana catesbeiana]|uniref:Lipoxygenase domain-containing protein n=1 Tax=Aquarana catesbeiana TaxID=8400 RepID=A0A2G9QI99_AQUCT|nr:hypothetical protein AB205_0195900 [Aquarana catesbeiana]